GEVKVWETQTGLAALTLKGHAGVVLSVCFSPDGKRLASASQGFDRRKLESYGEVKVWSAQTGEEILTLERHTGFATSVCFSPDGRRLASACVKHYNFRKPGEVMKVKPGEVNVWDAQTGET